MIPNGIHWPSVVREAHQKTHPLGFCLAQKLQISFRAHYLSQIPLKDMIKPAGLMVDVGSGYGILPLLMGLAFPEKKILGIELDGVRVDFAQRLCRDLPNASFRQGDANHLENIPAFDELIVCDVLHHLRYEDQGKFLSTAAARMNPGGHLIVIDVEKNILKPGCWMSYLWDYAMFPFDEKCNFFTPEEFKGMLSGTGLELIHSQKISSRILTSAVAYIARKNT